MGSIGTETAAATSAAPATAAPSAGQSAARRDQEPAGNPTAAITPENLRFELLRNALYHGDRLAHYTRFHRFVMFFTTLLGTAGVAAAVRRDPFWGSTFGVAVAFLSTLDLVLDFGGGARRHERLRERSFELMADLDGCEAGDHQLCRRVAADLTRSYGAEPHVMEAAGAVAWNAAYAATKGAGKFDPDDLLTLTWCQRSLRHLRRYAGKTFSSPNERRAAERRRQKDG